MKVTNDTFFIFKLRFFMYKSIEIIDSKRFDEYVLWKYLMFTF